jgi:hypothetical protein
MILKLSFRYLAGYAIKGSRIGQTENMASDEIDEAVEIGDPHEKFWRYFI